MVLGPDDESPQKGAIVTLMGDVPIVGRYQWQKQQSIEADRTYYSVGVRCATSDQLLGVEESDWPTFRPFATEVIE